MADNYMCPANPTVTHCSYAAKVNDLMGIDAETIARLRAEIERLRAALEKIAANTYGYEPNAMSDEEAVKYFAALFFGAQKTARAALGGGA